MSGPFGSLNIEICGNGAHLEEVILVDHTAVGKTSDQSVGEGGFPSVGNSVWKNEGEKSNQTKNIV